MTNLIRLSAEISTRPLLMASGAISGWAQKIAAIDDRALERPGRLGALFRKLSAPFDPALLEGTPVQQNVAGKGGYKPLYIGKPEDEGFCWSLSEGVALMAITTPLLDEGEIFCGTCYHGYDTLLAAMQEAFADVRVKGIFLKINSPGGVASGGIITLARWMREHRASAGGKPIYVYAKMACSAAQWIAAQADKVICPELAYVGSIGCYSLHYDRSAAYAGAGIKIEDFSMFDAKTDGADWKPMSKDGKAATMADIGQIVNAFMADMMAGRPNLTAEAIRDMHSRPIMSRHDDPARSGTDLGLVDEIADEEEAFAELVTKVSAPVNADSQPQAMHTGCTAAETHKEQPMADVSGAADQIAALKQTIATASATLARMEAKSADPEDAPADPEDGPEEGGEKPPKDKEKDKNDDPSPEDGEGEGENEAAAIAGSAEAVAHPEMARKAIAAGLSLKQFQAMTAGAGAEAPSKLSGILAATPRLGPDAVGGGKSADATLNADTIYARRAAACRGL